MIHIFVAAGMLIGGLALVLLSTKRPVTATRVGAGYHERASDRLGRLTLVAVGVFVVYIAIQLFFD